MSCVVLERRQVEGHFGREFTEELLPTRSDLMPNNTQNTSAELLNLASYLANNTQKFNPNSEHIKYWLWDDLKKVIELAGNIE